MSWWEAVPVLVTVLVVVLVPGGAVLAALGVRGVALLALAAPASAAVLGGGAIVVGLVGLGWSAWWVLPLTAVGVLVALPLRRRFGDPEALRHAPPVGAGWHFGGGLAVAALVGGLPVALALHRLDRPPQTYDSIFHLNAVRYIQATGRASSFQLGGLNNPALGRGFYPSGWHVLAGTVVDLTGADPAAVANATTIVLAALVFPLGTALAACALLPRWRWAAAVGAIAGTPFAALPVLMATFGTLWPNAWATSCLPAVLGATVMCLHRHRTTSWVAVIVALAGVALLHPSELFGYLLLLLPFVIQAVALRWRRLCADGHGRRVVVEAAVPAAVTLAVAGVVSRSTVLTAVRQYARGPSETLLHAFIEPPLDVPLIGSSYALQGPSWILGVLVGLGTLQALLNPRQWPWVGSLALAVIAFAISAGASADSPLRGYVTGFWYNDPIRLAGQVPVIAAPLAVVGIWSIARGLVFAAEKVRGLSAGGAPLRLARTAGIPGLVALVLVLTGAGYAGKREGRVTYYYWPPVLAGSRQLVSPAEEGLLRALPRLLPEDAVILADPYNGGSLAYALGNRRVVFPHVTGTYSAAALESLVLMPDLANPRTCTVLDTLGVRYLYVDTEIYLEGRAGQGTFRQLDEVPAGGVRLIRQAGSAALYEITGCP